jgi:hypothetical protein
MLHSNLVRGAQQGELDAHTCTSSSRGTPPIQPLHDYYPFALEDGGRQAPMVAELVDRLVILVDARRFPSLGAADSFLEV